MLDFNKVIKPHIVAAVAERFCCRGVRTHCVTKEKRHVRCVFEIQDGQSGKVLKMVEGGVTGYESFYLDDRALSELAEGKKPWAACFGTDGRWDALEVEGEAMKAVAEWARGKL